MEVKVSPVKEHVDPDHRWGSEQEVQEAMAFMGMVKVPLTSERVRLIAYYD